MSAASDRILYRARLLEEYGYQVHRTVRRLRERADVVALRDRPTFPTEAHHAGIVAGVTLALSGADPKSHHGDPCGPEDDRYAVCWAVGFLSIRHGAPLSGQRTGGRLWRFTDEEEAELIALVVEAGGKPYSCWRHDEGISVRIQSAITY